MAEELSDGTTRIRVAIADVDARVPKGPLLDAHAARNTVSVYAGDAVLPMLPERLSPELTSLVEGADRLAILAEMVVDAGGRTRDCAVYRAVVRNRAQLDYAARHCTEMEDRARRVERLLRKLAAMDLVQDRVGDVFEAIVTGASPRGTWVRVRHPAVEGRVVRGEHGMDVGDHVRVRLVHLDPERGFIDFARA
ncbi:MAG: RNB domain-containing ribonuclease [Gemmatimonadetes bacterium]|nr:RNB domain-containing ribonuclease [Gemmatimonadota bacterium]